MVKTIVRKKLGTNEPVADNKSIISFEDVMAELEEKLKDCPDIIRRKVNLKGGRIGYFLYVDNMVNSDLIQRDFIAPILNMEYGDLQDVEKLENLHVASLRFLSDVNSIVEDILDTNTVFIGEGIPYFVSCNLTNFEKRSIEEPITEKNIKGPHEGFLESLDVNLSILRRKIKNSNLKFKKFTIGATTNQEVVVAYIEGIANPSLLKTLCDKIQSIDFDGLPAIGYIDQFIADHPNSPFPQYKSSERPEKIVSDLLEGRLAIMIDGTPVALTVPVTFTDFFGALDDYSTNWMFESFLRLVRLLSFFIGVFLPGIYIAIISFHYYAIPLNMLIPLAESRAKVPFPPIIEAFIMELTLELLREASVRLPTYIGTAVGVVGGIVIGQAAVQVGLVSNLMVIIVAITGIATFTLPNYDMGLAARLLRFVCMIFAAVFGIIGIVVVGVVMIAHLVSMESLGQPYLQPLIPLKISDLKDSIVRLPLWTLRKRPNMSQPIDKIRGKNNE